MKIVGIVTATLALSAVLHAQTRPRDRASAAPPTNADLVTLANGWSALARSRGRVCACSTADNASVAVTIPTIFMM